MNSKVMKNRIEEQQLADKTFYFLNCLSLELTRKCNMCCKFCSRGKAQSLDMPKEIIDKILDEIEYFDLRAIRLNGGEPFLAKDGIIYLANEIIRRNIKLCQVVIFTNGTVQDENIKTALIRLGQHCKKISKTLWNKKMQEILTEYDMRSAYDNDTYVSIVVSTNLHDNSDVIDETIDFYNKDVDPKILHAVNQDTSFKGYSDTVLIKESPFDVRIVLRGNAKQNFKSLYDEGYRHFSLHENEFSLFYDDPIKDGYVIFPKAVSVSATGRVFPGCLMPYEEVDAGTDIIVNNILDCNGNLFAYLNKYSWQHPLTAEQAQWRDKWQTVLFFYENDMEDCWLSDMPDTPLTEGIAVLAAANIALMTEFEKGLIELHELFPKTLHTELNLFGAIKYAYSQKDMKTRKHILTNICGVPIGEGGIPDYSDETLENILDGFDTMYYNRQKEYFGDSSPSAALVQRATTDAIGNIAAVLLAGFVKQLFKK